MSSLFMSASIIYMLLFFILPYYFSYFYLEMVLRFVALDTELTRQAENVTVRTYNVLRSTRIIFCRSTVVYGFEYDDFQTHSFSTSNLFFFLCKRTQVIDRYIQHGNFNALLLKTYCMKLQIYITLLVIKLLHIYVTFYLSKH